jgi:hypothetical protein
VQEALRSRAVLAALIVALAILIHGWLTRPAHYSIVQAPGGIVRLDTQSGRMTYCQPSYSAAGPQLGTHDALKCGE